MDNFVPQVHIPAGSLSKCSTEKEKHRHKLDIHRINNCFTCRPINLDIYNHLSPMSNCTFLELRKDG